LLLKLCDALLDLGALRAPRRLHQVVLVEVEGALGIALAPAGLRHVVEKDGIVAHRVGLLEFLDGLIPAAQVEPLLSLAKMLARLFHRAAGCVRRAEG